MNTHGDDLSSRYKNTKVRVTYSASCILVMHLECEKMRSILQKSTEARLKNILKVLTLLAAFDTGAWFHMDWNTWKLGKHFPVR